MRLRHSLAAFALLLCLPMAGQAQLVLSFSPAVQSATPGTTVTFSGTIQNLSTSEVFLNATNFGPLAAGLLPDDTKFLNNAPTSLAGGANTGRIDLFDIGIDPSVSNGDYLGSFSILGGADDLAQDVVATQVFQVTVVPESGTAGWLLGGSLIGMCLAYRRRSRIGTETRFDSA